MHDFKDQGQAWSFDWWAGSAEQLISAGLAALDEFPGQPGRPARSVTLRPAAGKQGAKYWHLAPGYRWIDRRGDWFHLRKAVSLDERERRVAVEDAALEERRLQVRSGIARDRAAAEQAMLTTEGYRSTVMLHIRMLASVIARGNATAAEMVEVSGPTVCIEGMQREALLAKLRDIEAQVSQAAVVPWVVQAVRSGAADAAGRSARAGAVRHVLRLVHSRETPAVQ